MNTILDLPVDIFINIIAYLSFNDVINVCQSNSKLYNYSTGYNTRWKALINNMFSFIDNYDDKLEQIKIKIGIDENIYNYLVYTKLLDLLDPISQLMIYHRQGDMVSFDDDKYTKVQKFLSLFLLNKKCIINYLPDDRYLRFMDFLNGKNISKKTLDWMLAEMAKEGNVKGVKYFQQLGADIHGVHDLALRLASEKGHLDVVKFLHKEGANIIHGWNDDPLQLASKEGHLPVVEYLIKNGADIHARTDLTLRLASGNGHLDVVKYLIQNGANIHANNDDSIRLASEFGHLDIVKYLVENGANIYRDNDLALIQSSQNGHLDVVKYLIEKGANIHAIDDYALQLASENGHLHVVKYLISEGANVHANEDEALRWASEYGYTDVVDYLKSLKNKESWISWFVSILYKIE